MTTLEVLTLGIGGGIGQNTILVWMEEGSKLEVVLKVTEASKLSKPNLDVKNMLCYIPKNSAREGQNNGRTPA